MTHLQRFAVSKLLGRFNHEFEFTPDAPFIILHGPNGVGKTRMLELIESVFRFDVFKIAESHFASLSMVFSGGERLIIHNKTHAYQGNMRMRPINLTFRLSGKKYGKSGVSGAINFPTDEIPLAVWREVQNEMMQAVERDASPSMKLQMLEHSGGAYLPQHYRLTPGAARGKALLDLQEFDREIVEFLDQFDIHMVETQRLLILNQGGEAARRRSPESHPQRMKVSECARDLANRLAASLTENSRRSQELDKSFPRRVLDDSTFDVVPTEPEIRAAYEEQSKLRNRLAAIALLDESMDVPLQGGELVSWQRKVLWTYLQDSAHKLSTFQDLLNRVELFKSIIKSRFLFKRMIIDREAGFRFENDNEQRISPSQLSSGEQHEIVLIYDLLFNVRTGSLVLLDEPEISLHVAWQQEFLADIQRIAQLSNLRFVVATHSPLIINEWWGQAVALNAPEMKASDGAVKGEGRS
ncbi:AAA family ATPase [Streptomyces sp. NBC_00028]|uniref:AAA family ATPase n=1 Tax=Streptomyces sp. NBC_00028 TaxID=2975624 RepID=UPI0032529FF8